jgi:hypothetical protein
MALHGCHNLPREGKPLLVQDGWLDVPYEFHHGRRAHFITRRPLMREIPFVNSLDCRHDKKLTDPGCKDCKHAITWTKYDPS